MKSDWSTLAQHPVFLGGHRKSGTTLLLSLLDGHPQLGVFPADSGFFYAYYPVYDTAEYSREQKSQRLLEFAFKNIRHEWDQRIQLEPGQAFDFAACERDFTVEVNGGDGSARSVLLAMAGAYLRHSAVCQGSLRYWVEKTTSSEIYAQSIFDWFPAARFIHVVRDPRDNFGSLKSGWEKRYSGQVDSLAWLLQSMLDRGKLGNELAEVNQRLFGEERYLIVRYEDLVAQQQETLERICAFLGVEFHSSLLRPTLFGAGWRGNNFEGKAFTSISAENRGRWRERISGHEARVLEFHFRTLMERFGYPAAFTLKESASAARDHYKWFNYAQRHAPDIQAAAVPSP